MDFLHLSSFSLSTIAILLTASYQGHPSNEAQRENHALGDFSNIAYISDGKQGKQKIDTPSTCCMIAGAFLLDACRLNP